MAGTLFGLGLFAARWRYSQGKINSGWIIHGMALTGTIVFLSRQNAIEAQAWWAGIISSLIFTFAVALLVSGSLFVASSRWLKVGDGGVSVHPSG